MLAIQSTDNDHVSGVSHQVMVNLRLHSQTNLHKLKFKIFYIHILMINEKMGNLDEF